jgi:hypothetical protein
VKNADLDFSAVTGSKVPTDALTGSDISESTLSGVVKPCATGSVKALARNNSASAIQGTSYVSPGFGFTCRGTNVRARRLSTGVYHVCFANMGLPSSSFGEAMVTASIGTAPNSGNYAIADPFTDNCDPGDTISDKTLEVKVYNDDGGLEDGKFTLALF